MERGLGVPGFSADPSFLTVLPEPDIGRNGQEGSRRVPQITVTVRGHRPEDKAGNHIPRLNSPLPNLKLDVPYGEYRATYAKGLHSTLFCSCRWACHPWSCAQTGRHRPARRPLPAQRQDTQSTPSNQDPLKRPLNDKEKFKQQKELRKELKGPYKKWVDEDVRWIITDQELKAFKSLSNDEERDNFIEQFWQRRNPDPDSPENEYREENYRRIAYANEHFAAGKPGWKTDRGHMYIAYGKPDSIESHPSGGSYERPMEEGGGETSTFPFETWHYRYIEGIGENIDIEFVDTCMCGDYHMTLDRSEKDALLHVPGAGATLGEQMGTSKRTDRFNGGLENLGGGPMASSNQAKEFDRLEQFSKLQAPPGGQVQGSGIVPGEPQGAERTVLPL